MFCDFSILYSIKEFQLSGPLKNMKLCQAHFTPDSYNDDLVLRKVPFIYYVSPLRGGGHKIPDFHYFN